MGRLSVQAGPGAACAGVLGMQTHCTAAEVEPDMLLSPSLCAATFLPSLLCIPCSLPLWQLLKGMFLIPAVNHRPQLPSLGCPLPAPPARAVPEEPGLLLTILGSWLQTFLLLLEQTWAFSGCFLVGLPWRSAPRGS